MKFSYSTNVFRARPLIEAIEGIAKAGFCAVEIVADRPHAFPEELSAAAVAQLNQCLADKKIKVCNLNSSVVTAMSEVINPSWLEENWQHREIRIRYTLDCLRLAAAMGVPTISTNAGGEIPPTMDRKDAWRLLVANIHRILPLARKLGVKLLMEPEPGFLLETSDHALDFLKEFEFDEYLGLDFDGGHFFCIGEDPCDAWEKLKSHVAHVHLDDMPASRSHRHMQLGEGAVDIPALLGCIEEYDYKGCITIRVDAYEQKAEDLVAASAQYLRQKGFLPKSADAGA